jgi:hypothetical protein
MRATLNRLTMVVLLVTSSAHAADKTDEAIKAGGAVAAGAAVGGGAFAIVGSGGLAIAGTAVTVGLAPFVAAGAVVGLAGYGIYRFVATPGESKPEAQTTVKSPNAPPVAKKQQ